MSEPVLPAFGEVSATTSLSPDALWTFIRDPQMPARFSDELQEVTVVGGDHPDVGAVITGRNARGDFEWTTESYVVTCEEPTEFSWATGDEGDPTATWTLRVAPTPGGSVLTHSVIFHAGKAPLAPAIEKDPERAQEIVGGRMNQVRDNMQRTVNGIVSLAGSATNDT